jgi:hypothetical protein
MKTIKFLKGNDINKIFRVRDIVAHEKVSSGNYGYVSKSEWKQSNKTNIPIDIIPDKDQKKREKKSKDVSEMKHNKSKKK